MNLKQVTIAYIAYLILSAAVARNALRWLTHLLGGSAIEAAPWSLFLGVTVLLFIFLWKKNAPLLGKLLALLILGGVFLFLKGMRSPEERIHIFQYAVLGCLFAAIFRDKSWTHSLLLAWAGVLLVSSVDEIFQIFLPDRIGDIRDVGFGLLGGIWGSVTTVLLTRQRENRASL